MRIAPILVHTASLALYAILSPSAWAQVKNGPRLDGYFSKPIFENTFMTVAGLYYNDLRAPIGHIGFDYAVTKNFGMVMGYYWGSEPKADLGLPRIGPTLNFEFDRFKIQNTFLVEGYFLTRPNTGPNALRMRNLLMGEFKIAPDHWLKPRLWGDVEAVWDARYHTVVDRWDYRGGIGIEPIKNLEVELAYYRWHWTRSGKRDSQGLWVNLHYHFDNHKSDGSVIPMIRDRPIHEGQGG